MDAILRWNQIALNAVKQDFTTPDPSVDPSPEQGGPTRASRALAMVHLAMYDAYVGGTGSGATYLTYNPPPLPPPAIGAQRAAVATAATETLIALYGRQRSTFLAEHLSYLAGLGASGSVVNQGVDWGHRVALAILADRQGDSADAPDTLYAPSSEVGRHRVDPQNPGQGFLGPQWGRVKPFGITNLTTMVPVLDPPTLGSPDYARDFNEVKAKGVRVSGSRTPAETTVGLFWAYDGPRGIGVPPRLYNQVVRAIAAEQGSTEVQNAKLFAMVNVAMADAGIQAWYEKYLYNYWRPVVGIREADAGWGPTGAGDGNAGTQGDPYWLPLGAPRTNQPGRTSFTPNFPAYPSGHATFGTAALEVARGALSLGPGVTFELTSDEIDGQAVDNLSGSIRPAYKATITLDEAIKQNLESRIFLGVHWRFDGVEGMKNGKQIASLVLAHFPARA